MEDDAAEAEQKGIPSVCQDEDSSSGESMGSNADASREREQSCRDDDSGPDLSSRVQGEQSGDSTGDTLGDESLVTIQPEQHMMEPESAEEDTMHIMHDSPLGESQVEAHTEFMMRMWLTLGSAIEEEQSDAQTWSTVTAVVDPYPLEMVEVDGIVRQGASGQQEHYLLDQERKELLEMVEHPSLG